MEKLDTMQLIALAAALGWASGVRLYAVLFAVGAAGYAGWFEIPEHLRVLSHPLVLCASGFMVAAEFFADKIPGFDSVWDLVHTFIRIPAGAALAASVFGDSPPAWMLASAILGGTLAAGSHFTKAGARMVINTSPEPMSNWAASFGEDLRLALSGARTSGRAADRAGSSDPRVAVAPAEVVALHPCDVDANLARAAR
jgi:hypothetical protein